DVAESTRELAVTGMHCASCVGRVERVLKAIPGVRDAGVNLATEKAVVKAGPGTTNEQLVAAIQRIGFDATIIEDASADETSRQERQDIEQDTLRRDFLIALVVTLPVFILEMGGHLVPALHRWIDAAVGTQASWYAQFV